MIYGKNGLKFETSILPHMRYHYGSSRNRGSVIGSNGR
jgi:hypothetical protein